MPVWTVPLPTVDEPPSQQQQIGTTPFPVSVRALTTTAPVCASLLRPLRQPHLDAGAFLLQRQRDGGVAVSEAALQRLGHLGAARLG